MGMIRGRNAHLPEPQPEGAREALNRVITRWVQNYGVWDADRKRRFLDALEAALAAVPPPPTRRETIVEVAQAIAKVRKRQHTFGHECFDVQEIAEAVGRVELAAVPPAEPALCECDAALHLEPGHRAGCPAVAPAPAEGPQPEENDKVSAGVAPLMVQADLEHPQTTAYRGRNGWIAEGVAWRLACDGYTKAYPGREIDPPDVVRWLLTRAELYDAEKQRTERAEQQLSEAAMRINCAGPVAHRIDVLRAELSEAVTKAESELADARRQLAEAQQQIAAQDEEIKRLKADIEEMQQRLWEYGEREGEE